MVLALGGASSTALLTPAELDWRLLLGAIGVAWTAAGGVQWAKRLIWPKDPPPLALPPETLPPETLP